MQNNEETRETWNKLATLYEEKFMHLHLYDETYDFICDAITRQQASILEIGCGPGNISKYLLSKRPDFTIHGIDIAANMIALAQKNNPAASYSVMDCRHISGFAKKIDGIIAGFCLPYLSIAESEKLISDAGDLLQSQGILYLSFVEGDPGLSGYQVGSTGDRLYFYYHQLDTVTTQMRQHGFELLKIFKVAYKKSPTETDIHTIVTAKKI
jgi:predicted TPR repeat methyltransferase